MSKSTPYIRGYILGVYVDREAEGELIIAHIILLAVALENAWYREEGQSGWAGCWAGPWGWMERRAREGRFWVDGAAIAKALRHDGV